MKLLHVDASILGDRSVTRELSALIVRRVSEGEEVALTYRDLSAEHLPHLSPAAMPAAHPASAPIDPNDAEAQAVRDTSDRILAEFLAADTVVIGSPMYNFTIPSQLKAWIDRLCVPGTTFRYGPTGVEGLAGGKRVVIALARGGFYGPEAAAAEHAESYLRYILAFVGITDPEFVFADGLATGADNKALALTSARAAVERLAA